MRGIIFDFNGTLYWDSQLHYDAWREYSAMLRETPFSDEEMRDRMFGHTNSEIIEYLIGRKPSKEMVEKYAKENGCEVLSMVRYAVGEGIEKRQENFAEEVAAQMNAAN